MIGQKALLSAIDKILDRFPRFSIIVGAKGSGKKTLCKEIVKRLKLSPLYFGTKIEDIRKAIDLAYTQVEPIAFIIPDADKMSLAAKNSLLKITEEPPRNCYFILTLENLDNTLATIQSRGTVFKLAPYTNEEILQYRQYKGYSSDFDNIVSMVCNNTGEVDELFSYNVQEFYQFADCIVNNIHIPKSGNAFKITKRLKTKESDNDNSLYDANLLFKAVQKLFLKKGKETKNKGYLLASIETGRWLQQLQIPSVSKQGIADMWIIGVRSNLREL